MKTILFSHPASLDHLTPDGHPERPDRIRAINKVLESSHFRELIRRDAPLGRVEDILLCHSEDHYRYVSSLSPESGIEYLDPDTVMSPGSLAAALRAVGAATAAVDAVFTGQADNAFCATRPPGHHAERARPMGFCLFNQVAIAAHHARNRYDAERVAVVDFDVHHGNGTQDIFWSDPDMFYGSTHQMPLFPGSGAANETGMGNIFNAPLRAGDGSAEFREAMRAVILPALDVFAPDFILISAGFDAHHRDPLGSLRLSEEDFAWVTLEIMGLADNHCESRVVSVLEGGYDLQGLAASVGIHIQALMHGAGEPDPDEDDEEEYEDLF